jgi:WhiB family redox-sensing transcriptional regulator
MVHPDILTHDVVTTPQITPLDNDEHITQDNWELYTFCAGMVGMSDLFFSERSEDIESAKAICRQCRVARFCLDAAIERRENFGVWGGQQFSGGKAVRSRKK